MEGLSRTKQGCPQFLDRAWLKKGDDNKSEDEKKLELRLAPPGEDWSINDEKKRVLHPALPYGCYPSNSKTWLLKNDGASNHKPQQQQPSGGAIYSSPWNPNPSTYLYFPSAEAMEASKPCCTKGAGEKMACSLPCATTAPATTAVATNSSHKRSAPAPVVGWPPVRAFRKNATNTSSSNQVIESQNEDPPKQLSTKKEESCPGMFVKINMDGVPIGRKVDLKAHHSYESLSSAVDELFRGLLATQRDSCNTGNHNKAENVKEITGLLDGSGEYTLVYEDNEGDRMLVGDVPWNMFVSGVKRLRVLKSSELSALRAGNGASKEKRQSDFATK